MVLGYFLGKKSEKKAFFARFTVGELLVYKIFMSLDSIFSPKNRAAVSEEFFVLSSGAHLRVAQQRGDPNVRPKKNDERGAIGENEISASLMPCPR